MERFAAVLLAAMGITSTQAHAQEGYRTYRSDSSFEDTLDGLKAAIQERGMYINNVMDMSGMLERTGQDLGLAGGTYAQASSVEFCSAPLAHQMTAEHPARIINCPFIISLYRLSAEPGATYVVHRGIPRHEQDASPAMAKIATMLQELSEAAIAW